MERLDSEYIEKLITKAMLSDKNFLVLISSVFEKEYFNDTAVSTIFEFSKTHMEEFKTIPPRDVIIHSIQDESIQKDVEELFGEIDSIEFNIPANYDYLLKETNEYLKEQAIKRAIVESVDIVDNRDQREQIREKIESALCKDIKVDLGLSYFEDLGARLRRIFTATDIRVPTYFPKFDEYINGGFPPFTLSVIVARIHGMKCLCRNTPITIKNKKTGLIEDTRIEGFFRRFHTMNKYIVDIKKENETMLGLEGMKKKYGDEEGTRRYVEWKKNVGKASKNRNTLSYFKKKYGDNEGVKKHKHYIDKQKKSNSLEGYIERYGEDDGKKKWNERYDGRKHTLEGYIEKHGEDEGRTKFKLRQYNWQNTMKSKPQDEIDRINESKKNTVDNFIKRYGKEEGIKKYIKRNERQSKSLRKVDVELIPLYERYKEKVRKISNRNIEIHGLSKSELRSRNNHLDHKVSICYGFNNSVDEEVIGSIHNLEIITASENCSKQSDNSMDIDKLIEKCNGDI